MQYIYTRFSVASCYLFCWNVPFYFCYQKSYELYYTLERSSGHFPDVCWRRVTTVGWDDVQASRHRWFAGSSVGHSGSDTSDQVGNATWDDWWNSLPVLFKNKPTSWTRGGILFKGQIPRQGEIQWYLHCKAHAGLSPCSIIFKSLKKTLSLDSPGGKRIAGGRRHVYCRLVFISIIQNEIQWKQYFFFPPHVERLEPRTEANLLFKSLRYHLNKNIPNVTVSILKCKNNIGTTDVTTSTTLLLQKHISNLFFFQMYAEACSKFNRENISAERSVAKTTVKISSF